MSILTMSNKINMVSTKISHGHQSPNPPNQKKRQTMRSRNDMDMTLVSSGFLKANQKKRLTMMITTCLIRISGTM